MKIFVDVDACPVVRIVEKLAKNMRYPAPFYATRIMCLAQTIVRS